VCEGVSVERDREGVREWEWEWVSVLVVEES
jgi:hypothetical protein